MKVTKGIQAPKKAGDAGYDLLAAQHSWFDFNTHQEVDGWVIEPRERCTILTDAAGEIPEGWCGIIIGRSGLNTAGIECTVGLWDSGYRGYVKVVLENKTTSQYRIPSGARVAQVVFLPHGNFPLEYVEDVSGLTPSERGDTGFGSTGR